MYEKFYGFSEKPFSILPDPSFLYLSAKHQRALAMLEYGVVNQAGFSVITGDIGSGKTTLVRKLMRQIEGDVTVGLVANVQTSSFNELMQWILFSFSLEYRGKDKVEMFEIFTDFLIKEYAANHRTLLIIDEAQNLGPEALEQLRMLSNINADKHQVLQLILVGQPDLWDILKQPELRQFVQRIAVDYHLEPLDYQDTQNYIRHRLQVAGGNPDLFLEDTYQLIWRATGGVPRIINLLCDAALVYAFADQKERVDGAIVQAVLEDKQHGLSPIGQSTSPEPVYRKESGGSVEARVDVGMVKAGSENTVLTGNATPADTGEKPKRRGISSIEKLFTK